MYGADLACGVDLLLEPDPDKYARRGQPAVAEIRRELTFYDLWVARDIWGRRFAWAPPFVQDVEAAPPGAGGRHRRGLDTGGPLGLPEHRDAFPAFCCWNGLAVLGAEPFYRCAAAAAGYDVDHHHARTCMYARPCSARISFASTTKLRGLRFRSSRPGQGVLSECTHVCLDLWANGLGKVVVDPQVREYVWVYGCGCGCGGRC